MALETAAEAFVPVKLALLELALLQLWEAYAGSEGGDPTQRLFVFGREAIEYVPEWDTMLIIVLNVLLGAVLLLRQRQRLQE